MAKKEPVRNARPGVVPSLAPLTPDQALGALLRVKPADLKKLEAREKRAAKKRD